MPISHLRIALAATALAASAVALAGCSVLPVSDSPTSQADYRTWPAKLDAADPAPPEFVPHDATEMYVRVRDADGAAIVTYRSASEPTGCALGTLSGHPKIDSNWWPIGKPPAEGQICSSGWQVFEKDGATYGWRP